MARKRAAIRHLPRNVMAGLFGPSLSEEKRKKLIDGLGIKDAAVADNIVKQIETELRRHSEILKRDQLNDAPAVRARKLKEIEKYSLALSKAIDIDYECYQIILSYMNNTKYNVNFGEFPLKKKQISSILENTSVAAGLARRDLANIDNNEPAHFRYALARKLEKIWTSITNTEITRSNKNRSGNHTLSPIQFFYEVFSEIYPDFDDGQADYLIQEIKSGVGSGENSR